MQLPMTTTTTRVTASESGIWDAELFPPCCCQRRAVLSGMKWIESKEGVAQPGLNSAFRRTCCGVAPCGMRCDTPACHMRGHCSRPAGSAATRTVPSPASGRYRAGLPRRVAMQPLGSQLVLTHRCPCLGRKWGRAHPAEGSGEGAQGWSVMASAGARGKKSNGRPAAQQQPAPGRLATRFAGARQGCPARRSVAMAAEACSAVRSPGQPPASQPLCLPGPPPAAPPCRPAHTQGRAAGAAFRFGAGFGRRLRSAASHGRCAAAEPSPMPRHVPAAAMPLLPCPSPCHAIALPCPAMPSCPPLPCQPCHANPAHRRSRARPPRAQSATGRSSSPPRRRPAPRWTPGTSLQGVEGGGGWIGLKLCGEGTVQRSTRRVWGGSGRRAAGGRQERWRGWRLGEPGPGSAAWGRRGGAGAQHHARPMPACGAAAAGGGGAAAACRSLGRRLTLLSRHGGLCSAPGGCGWGVPGLQELRAGRVGRRALGQPAAPRQQRRPTLRVAGSVRERERRAIAARRRSASRADSRGWRMGACGRTLCNFLHETSCT